MSLEPVGRDDLALSNAFSPAESDTEHRMLAIWEDVLNIRGLGIDDDFFEINGQSFVAVTLFTEMERLLGEMPPVSALLKSPTVRLLTKQTDALHRAAAQHPIVPFRTNGARPPLFVIHGAGGNVLFARMFLPYLNPQQPLYGIEARGLVQGEPPHNNLDAMIEDYLVEVRRIQPHGPYYLAGFCTGTFVAYEMAQRIVASGDRVEAVIGIDPNFNRMLTPWLYWRKPDSLPTRLRRIAPTLAWRAIRQWQRLRGDLSVAERAANTPEARQRYFAIEAGSIAAFKHYRPRPYGGRMVIFCSAERRRRLADPVTGMPALVPGVKFVEVASAHLELFSSARGKLLPAVAAELRPA